MSGEATSEVEDTITPVEDFAVDWDFNDPAWVEDPYPIWDDLRGRCPMGHSDWLDPDGRVEWSTGQIRGPRSIPIIVG